MDSVLVEGKAPFSPIQASPQGLQVSTLGCEVWGCGQVLPHCLRLCSLPESQGFGLPKLLGKKRRKGLEKAQGGCTKPCPTAAATVLPPHTLLIPVSTCSCVIPRARMNDSKSAQLTDPTGKLVLPQTSRLAGPGKAKGFMVSWLNSRKLLARPGGSQSNVCKQ